MFDQKDNRIDQAYLDSAQTAADTTYKLAQALIELIKALKKIWDIEQEKNKVAVKVGEETYNLSEDKDGTYKWEKVDLNNEQSTTNDKDPNPLQYNAEIESPFTEYQAQTIATKLLTDAPGESVNYDQARTNNPEIQIALLRDEGGDIVLYEMNEEGECIKNSFTQELSQEQVIDAAYEPLSEILPPNSPLLLPPGKDNIEAENIENIDIATSADDMLSQVVGTYVESQPEQYDADGLIIDDNSPIPAASLPENNVETTIENIDIDGLIIDDNTPISAAFSDKAANTITENMPIEIDTDGLIIDSSINEQYQVLDATSIEANQTEVITQAINSENLTVNETTYVIENVNAETVDYIPPSIDDVGFISDINISEPPEFDGPPDDDYGYKPPTNNQPSTKNTSLEPEPEPQFSTAPTTPTQTDEEPVLGSKKTQVIEEEPSSIVKRKSTAKVQDEPAANYTYQQVASNPDVEPQAQQWARQSTVPIYEIKHGGERARVDLEKNQNIANTATEMLKKYGTIENDGSRIYRSDAFAIRQEDGVISIHRRGDEAKGFNEPLMQFKLNDKGVPDIKGESFLNNLKGNITQNNLSPVEKQEFLIVAERIADRIGLPDLQSGDVRETANALGSLAPAGTLRTLDNFKKSEMLEMLNSTLNQTKSDEVKVGDFTIKRERDPENNRASLVLTKDSDDGRGKQELARFNLEKTPDGIKSEVVKMNISDYDIGQVKFIAQNAYKLDTKNLESNFDNPNTPKATTPPPQSNQANPVNQPDKGDGKNVGDIPVNVHPWIADEWQKMASNAPNSQENSELLQKLEQNGGKLPINEQREMYDKIVTNKIEQAQASGNKDATVTFIPKKDVTADLLNERSRTINEQFTPKENITQKQAQVKRASLRPVVKQPQGVER